MMTRHCLERFAAQYGKDIHGVTWRAQAVLARHSWPGNVRELENVIGSACMMAMGDTIDVADLPEYMRAGHATPAATPVTGLADAGIDGLSLDDQERHLLAAALEKSRGNQSQAANLGSKRPRGIGPSSSGRIASRMELAKDTSQFERRNSPRRASRSASLGITARTASRFSWPSARLRIASPFIRPLATS